jgi:transcriptional regulator with XRE-family HTH domain
MRRGWVVSPDYRSVIETIVQARKDQGIGQRELARRLGKPPSFTNKIEILERRLDVLEFIAIAKALGLDPTALTARIVASLPKDVQL